MIEIILGSCLAVSIVAIIIMATKKTPFGKLVETNTELINTNTQLKSEIENLKSQLSHSEKRRKNLLSLNKGERALIPGYSLTFGRGTKDEIDFKAYVECDVIEVTDKKIKVVPYRVITDNNEVNADQSKLQGIIDFLKDKWVDISDVQPILDTQVRREDKLEELNDVLN